MTQDDPVDPGVRHDQEIAVAMRQHFFDCGDHPPLQVGNIFTARGPEADDRPASLPKRFGPVPADLGKRQALPTAQANLSQCGRRYDIDGATGGNDPCSAHAALQIARENLVDPDFRQPIAPEPSLAATAFIERWIGLTDELLFLCGGLNFAMAQQK
jgi:hypothetical protein